MARTNIVYALSDVVCFTLKIGGAKINILGNFFHIPVSYTHLGNTADIAALSQIAHSYGVPLLCDNAHGAYLHFLREKCHPMEPPAGETVIDPYESYMVPEPVAA